MNSSFSKNILSAGRVLMVVATIFLSAFSVMPVSHKSASNNSSNVASSVDQSTVAFEHSTQGKSLDVSFAQIDDDQNSPDTSPDLDDDENNNSETEIIDSNSSSSSDINSYSTWVDKGSTVHYAGSVIHLRAHPIIDPPLKKPATNRVNLRKDN